MKSIRFKLWTGMMALTAIFLVILWLFQIVFLERFYTGMHISGAKKEAALVVEMADKEGGKVMEDRLETLSYKYNMSIELIDLQGRAVYRTGTMGAGGQMPMMMNGKREEVYQQVLSGKTAELLLTHPRFGNEFMMIGIPVEIPGTAAAGMIMNLPLAPVEDTAAILKQQLLYITLILSVASLLISWLISKNFTKPILNIKSVSESMAKGDFSARIHSRNRDEIGELASTINTMGEQLSKIEQLRKDLIANISHELRTPLSLIRGYAETIRDVTGEVREKREKQLGIIIDETERLSRIVDDVLNLSQLQSGYIKLEKSRFSAVEMVEAVIKRYEVLSDKAGVGISCRFSADAVLEADRGRIEQVFYNLINNAFDHTPPGGRVTVDTVLNAASVRFMISDTGTGISEEDIPRIWERFYKSNKTGSKRSAGTGLGLAIAKGILDAHQVLYGVESRKGFGTTFWFEVKTV